MSCLLDAQATSAQSSDELNFIFVFNTGGWDPTRVFVDAFDEVNVDMEPQAQRNTLGDLVWVSHDNRPSVDAFFQQYASDVLFINGLQVRSISHEICTSLALTGGTSGGRADWGTLIAANSKNTYPIPHLILGGSSFAGELGAYVARAGNDAQLERLLDGSILQQTNFSLETLSESYNDRIDQHLQARNRALAQRASSLPDSKERAFYESSGIAHQSLLELKQYRHWVNFSQTQTLSSQVEIALDVFEHNLSRVVSLSHPGLLGGTTWDTHADNDAQQSMLFEQLFDALLTLKIGLGQREDRMGRALSSTTVVVVLSEMGRTPKLNGTLGKDHWPYSSMMLWGPQLTTDRVVGGVDELYKGFPVDLSSGEIEEHSGELLMVESIGAALLALADVDPKKGPSDAQIFRGIIHDL
ncbi:MAG: hypothetical protein CMK59_04405 [Proteobacteria bacterium]|nr:hypothetical protein [Pseudomonadota bacterium]